MKELVKLFNKYKSSNGTIDDFLDQNSDNPEINCYTFKFIDCLDIDEHRWYCVETNVYEVLKGEEHIGYVAVTEVGTLKSESMSCSDCGIETEFYEVKEVVKKSFEIVK